MVAREVVSTEILVDLLPVLDPQQGWRGSVGTFVARALGVPDAARPK